MGQAQSATGGQKSLVQIPDGAGGLRPPLDEILYPRLLEGINQESR